MRLRMLAAGAVFMTACGGGAVIPSQVITAVNWGPVQPTYNGTVRAWASGRYENRGGSFAATTGSYADRAADGNTAYFCTVFDFFYKTATADAPAWVPDGQACTGEISTADGAKPIEDVNHELLLEATSTRGENRACAQFGWPVPDPCASAIAAFDY